MNCQCSCLTLNDFQNEARKTAVYPVLGHAIVYPTIGLAGEAGEVAEKVKKAMRDDNMIVSERVKDLLCKELGDVLWYVSEVAFQAGLTLQEVAECNIEKLKDRQKRNVLNGSGDER